MVLADTYLPLLRVIAGDTRQFKATLLILQDRSISLELFKAKLLIPKGSRSSPKRFKITLLILQGSSIGPKQFKITLLILQGCNIGLKQFKIILPISQRSNIILNLFMTIFQHQLQPDLKYCSKGNAIEIHRLKVAEVDDVELRPIPQHLHNH